MPEQTDQIPPSGEGAKALSGIYAIVFPPDENVWRQVRQIISDAKIRMNELSTLVCQDPALAIDLLKTANSMFFSAGRPPVTTVKGIIERLGVDAAIQTLEKLKETPQLADPRANHWYGIARQRCRYAGRIARLTAEVLAPNLAEDCELAGVLTHVGELLPPFHLGEQFTKMADEQQSRSKILYRLEKDMKFDVFTLGVQYLRRIGIPEAVLFAVDPQAQSKVPARALMRPICSAASELAVVGESGKLDRYAPEGGTIPPKSAVRMLKMTDQQYATLFEKVTGFFLTEAQKAAAAQSAAQPTAQA